MGRTGFSTLLVWLGMTSAFAGCDVKDSDKDEGAGEGDVADDPSDEPSGDSDDEPSGPPAQPEPRPQAAVLCDAENGWQGNACELDGGGQGVSFCIVVEGEQFDTPCAASPGDCDPGDNFDMGCMGSICTWNGVGFELYEWSDPDCATPLVLELEGPTSFMPATASAFDLSTDGSCQSTDWPTSPWLALDRDGDGAITSGAELFGSATKMSTGGFAEHGFAALAELDDDRDGKITAKDAAFAKLVVWSDLDDDRRGMGAELRSLAEVKLVAIDLGFSRKASCDGHGNCGNERAAFEYHTADGATAMGDVVDVYLQCR